MTDLTSNDRDLVKGRLTAEQRAPDAGTHSVAGVMNALSRYFNRARPKHPTDDEIAEAMIDNGLAEDIGRPDLTRRLD